MVWQQSTTILTSSIHLTVCFSWSFFCMWDRGTCHCRCVTSQIGSWLKFEQTSHPGHSGVLEFLRQSWLHPVHLNFRCSNTCQSYGRHGSVQPGPSHRYSCASFASWVSLFFPFLGACSRVRVNRGLCSLLSCSSFVRCCVVFSPLLPTW